MSRRKIGGAALGAVAATLAAPSQSFAHGISSRSDLPIPAWLWGWGAAAVLAASFFAFAALWREPILENARETRVMRIPTWLEAVCGVLGVALFTLLVYAGFAGSQISSENIIITFVYVTFWAGLPLVVALLGNFYPAFNPWRAVGRFCGWTVTSISGKPLPPSFNYPERLGRWPALIALVGFGWLELISTSGSDPSFVALAAIVYALLQLVGMSLFGVDRWLERGDAFTVYFGMFGRIAALASRDGYIVRRKYLAGLADMQWLAGTVTFICAAIGITAFDGLSEGSLWSSVGGTLQDVFTGIGFSNAASLQFAYSIGLAFCIAAIALFYRIGVYGMSGASTGLDTDQLSRTFAASLVPISLAYVVAHYFSFVAFQGQAMIALASDPLGNGSNWLGTASVEINYRLLSASAIWYVQVAALVLGHVAALAVAHDKALAVFGQARAAVTSQYWMLVVMVGFTNLGLWLLSVANQ